MNKRTYFVIMIVSIIVSFPAIYILCSAISERGFTGANYGAIIPVLIAIWSFIMWKKSK